MAPIVGCTTLAFALHGFRRSPGATEATTALAALDTPAQAIQPLRELASLAASGEGLSLSLDGNDIGALPRELHGLEPGEHSVTISGGPRYRPFQTRVNLAPGRVTSLGPVKLEVARGLATVQLGVGADGADVTLKFGDSEMRLPPLPVQLEVETDKTYTLLAQKAGFRDYEQPLTFEAGQAEKTFSVELSELPRHELKPEPRRRERSPYRGGVRSAKAGRAGRQTAATKPTLTLWSTPDSAVVLDGIPLGTTPLLDVAVTPGSHRVIFIYGTQRKAMVVLGVSGQNRVVSTTFPSSAR